MKDDLEGKTLRELQELHQQLTHEINVMDHMRVRQVDSAVDAAGGAARELTSERRIAIHADINSRFLPYLTTWITGWRPVTGELIGSVRIKTLAD